MTQVLPQDYDLDVGTEPWPGTALDWVCARQTGESTSIGYLHSAYQGSNGGDGFQVTNAASSRSGGNNADPVGFVHKMHDHPADCTVTAVFRVFEVGGALDQGSRISEQGVYAWVHGGSISNDNTVSVSLDDFDGWYFAVNPGSTGNGIDFDIFEVQAGVSTSRATANLAYADSAVAGADFTAPLTVTMTLAESGGNVNIDCSLSGWGVLSGYDPFSGTQTIAKPGGWPNTINRCGFRMGHARNHSSSTINLVDLCEVFQVKNSSGTVLIRDEFDRFGLGGYQLAAADTHSNQGRLLSGGWYWDQASYDADSDGSGLDGSGPLLKNDSSGTAFINAEGAHIATQCALLSSRAAGNPRSQNRSVDITASAAPSAIEYRAGVCLRSSQQQPITFPASVSGALEGFTGYVALARFRTSSTVTFQLLRVLNGQPTTIGELDDVSPYAYFPGYTSAFTLELDVHSLTGATVDGPTVLEMKVDSVTVPLEDQSVTGVSIASGVVTDTSVDRITSGSGEGLYWASALSSGTRRVDFANWAQGTLSNEGAVSPNDQASVTVDDEGSSSASGDLSTAFAPEFPVIQEFLYPTHSARFEAGYRAVVPQFDKRRRTLSLRSTVVDKADRDAFWTFYDDHEGVEIPFNYTSPTESTSRVWRFVDDQIRETKVAPGLYRFAFRIQEVL